MPTGRLAGGSASRPPDRVPKHRALGPNVGQPGIQMSLLGQRHGMPDMRKRSPCWPAYQEKQMNNEGNEQSTKKHNVIICLFFP